MARFVKVESEHGDEMYINADTVRCVKHHQAGSEVIYDGNSGGEAVAMAPNELVALLSGDKAFAQLLPQPRESRGGRR